MKIRDTDPASGDLGLRSTGTSNVTMKCTHAQMADGTMGGIVFIGLINLLNSEKIRCLERK